MVITYMISSVEDMSWLLLLSAWKRMTLHKKAYKFTLKAEKLFWTLPLTTEGVDTAMLGKYYITRYGKRVPERFPSRLNKIFCKEYVLNKFLLPTSLSYEIRQQPQNEQPVGFSPRNPSAPTASAKANTISGNRGKFSNMSGLSSSTAFNPRETASSIWSLMILFRGQIANSIMANTWNRRLFPKPVANTAITPFSPKRLFLLLFFQIDRSSTGP